MQPNPNPPGKQSKKKQPSVPAADPGLVGLELAGVAAEVGAELGVEGAAEAAGVGAEVLGGAADAASAAGEALSGAGEAASAVGEALGSFGEVLGSGAGCLEGCAGVRGWSCSPWRWRERRSPPCGETIPPIHRGSATSGETGCQAARAGTKLPGQGVSSRRHG